METEAPAALPEGEYAIVEVMGHRTLVGRITEVERFGSKLMSIEPVFRDQLLQPVLIGGSSIYQFTPCTAEIAQKQQPRASWQLSSSIRVTLPAALLGKTIEEVSELSEWKPEFAEVDDD